jgi:hypothetical protein
MSNVREVLNERGKRYGEFSDFAEAACELREVVANHQRNPMSRVQAEAMSMILHKIARITTGDPSYDDSWLDIAGYAQLVVDELRSNDKV